MLLKIILIIQLLFYTLCSTNDFNQRINDIVCPELPMDILEYLLGAAYNPRYMSVNKPQIFDGEHAKPSMKRTAIIHEDFYVDKDFYDVIDNRPAWAVENHVKITNRYLSKRNINNETMISRNRRDIQEDEQQQQQEHYHRIERDFKKEWHCKSKIDWIDLGDDYFPRYLRSVQCLTEKCWFNLYRCKPRSFTVKILRRRRGRCVISPKNTKIGTDGLPQELRELWVWEERAINFCCDCGR